MPGKRKARSANGGSAPANELRIIGGSLRGRRLHSTADGRTRPMKNRVREAVFNLLGPDVVGTHAFDLFAGSGALGLEAISRGATHATLIERHLPTAELIRRNAAELQVADRAEVVWADAFLWDKDSAQPDGNLWLVFCSPPFDYYVDREPEMVSLVQSWMARAPRGSTFVIESDRRFDPRRALVQWEWSVREYPPAVVAIGCN